MIRKFATPFLFLALLLLLVVSRSFYSPESHPISVSSVENMSAAVANKIEHEYSHVEVSASVVRNSDDGSAVIQYVLIYTFDPNLLSGQPMTPQQAADMQRAFDTFTGSLADLLRYSQQIVLYHSTVVQINVMVITKDAQIMQGGIMTEKLKSLPALEDDLAWLQSMAMAPAVVVLESIWSDLLTIPEVQDRLSNGP